MARLWWPQSARPPPQRTAVRPLVSLRGGSPTRRCRAVVYVRLWWLYIPSSDRHHDGGKKSKVFLEVLRSVLPAVVADPPPTARHNGSGDWKKCDGRGSGSAVVTRREGLKVAAGGVIWWPTARLRWCEGGDEGDGCDGSMVEGGGTRRRRWQRCLARKFFWWPE
ncbi:hypothetical protein Tco_0131012 [Tanacetum coccineum]